MIAISLLTMMIAFTSNLLVKLLSILTFTMFTVINYNVVIYHEVTDLRNLAINMLVIMVAINANIEEYLEDERKK